MTAESLLPALQRGGGAGVAAERAIDEMHVIGVDDGVKQVIIALSWRCSPKRTAPAAAAFERFASISSANPGVQSITMRSASSNFRKSEFSTTSLAYFVGEKRPTLILKRMIGIEQRPRQQLRLACEQRLAGAALRPRLEIEPRGGQPSRRGIHSAPVRTRRDFVPSGG